MLSNASMSQGGKQPNEEPLVILLSKHMTTFQVSAIDAFIVLDFVQASGGWQHRWKCSHQVSSEKNGAAHLV